MFQSSRGGARWQIEPDEVRFFRGIILAIAIEVGIGAIVFEVIVLLRLT